MGIISFINLVGTACSIGSAVYAFIQARKAMNSASKAEKYCNIININKEENLLYLIDQEHIKILNVISKYGPSCTIDKLCGLDISSDGDKIQQYIILLRSNIIIFDTEDQYTIENIVYI